MVLAGTGIMSGTDQRRNSYKLMCGYWQVSEDLPPNLLTWDSPQSCLKMWQLVPSDCAIQQRVRETPRQEPKAFYNPILEAMPYHFCHILQFRRKSRSPVHTQGEGISQKPKYQEVRIWGEARFRGCLPSCVLPLKLPSQPKYYPLSLNF